MSESPDSKWFSVLDEVTGNLIHDADTLEDAKRWCEEVVQNPTGLAVLDDDYHVVYRYHGPMVTP